MIKCNSTSWMQHSSYHFHHYAISIYHVLQSAQSFKKCTVGWQFTRMYSSFPIGERVVNWLAWIYTCRKMAHKHIHFFFHIHNLFHDFLNWLSCNPVKSCSTSVQFSPVGIYCFRLYSFHSFFYNNDGIFNGVILPDFYGVPPTRVLFIQLTILPIEYCV